MTEENNPDEQKKSGPEKASEAITDGVKSGNIDNVRKNLTGAALSSVPAGEKIQEAQEKIYQAKKNIALGKAITAKLAAFFKGLIALIVNPVSLIIILILVIAFYFFNATTFIGRNDNADGCYGIGGTTTVTYSMDTVETSNSIMSWLSANESELTNGPMNKIQAAAFVGNWWLESGLNPSASQQGQFNSNSSNQDLLDFGSSNGYGVGLVQWDGGRRLALARYAEEQNKNWNDIEVQLNFVIKELNDSYSKKMKDDGFNDANKTLDELVDIVNKRYEVSGDRDYEGDEAKTEIRNKRVNYANEAFNNFSGNYTSNAGGSCLIASVDMSDAVQLAISMSYPLNSDADRVSKGDYAGNRNVLPTYREAKGNAESIKRDGSGLFASCDKFVATVVILTMDEDIPWGHTGNQYEYLNNSHKWERYDDFNQREPGDVWITVNRGHIVMYVGNVDGTDSIAHASFHSRVAGLDPSSWIGPDFTDTLGRKYAGFRYVGG